MERERERERRLYEASLSGNVDALKTLIQEDQLILDRVTDVTCFDETPLHIAALRGHFGFTAALLSLNPNLAIELDSFGRSPLHLASVKGYIATVRELLGASTEVCLVRDHDGRIPLHLAAMKGRVEVIGELIRARPESTRERLDHGETILHLCVRYNRLEALKLLVESMSDNELVNSMDNDGNTILHAGAALKQMEIIKYLLSTTGFKANANVNAKNLYGLTALDVLDLLPRDLKGMEVRDLLRDAGVKRATELGTPPPPLQGVVHHIEAPPRMSRIGRWMKYLSNHGDNWLEKTQGTLMLVATVIATITFQTALNPPGGVWQEDTENKGSYCTDPKCEAGTSVLAYGYPDTYFSLLCSNTISFVSSLSIILLLISGFPLKNKICMWLLTVAMCTTLSFMALTYLKSMASVTPIHLLDSLDHMMYLPTVYIWIGLLLLVGLIHTVRFLYWLVTKLKKFIHKMQSSPVNERQVLGP